MGVSLVAAPGPPLSPRASAPSSRRPAAAGAIDRLRPPCLDLRAGQTEGQAAHDRAPIAARRHERPQPRGVPPAGRDLSRHRRAGRLAHARPRAARRRVARDHPQRHAGSRASRPARQPACLAPAACRPSSGCGCSSTASSRSATSRAAERAEIERSLGGNERDITAILDRAGDMLSGLTHGASLVLAPKTEAPIKHIEFVALAPDRALVVLVTADGQVENRLFAPPVGPDALGDAGGRELPQRDPAGPHPRRDARRGRRRDRPAPRRARRSCRRT